MPTSNPVPSQDVSDLLFNAEKIDQFVNSTASTLTDRLGTTRQTIAGLSAEYPLAQANADAAAASAADALDSEQTAVDAAVAAEAAQVAAEAARDVAFISADVYASTTAAQGDAGLAVGEQYQVVSADGLTMLRYTKDSSSASTLVASYPASRALGNSAISYKSLSCVTSGKNLLDPTDPDFKAGYYISDSTGQEVVGAGFWCSGYIPVSAGVTYALSKKHKIAWYSAFKTFISGSSQLDTNQIQTAPSESSFLRITFDNVSQISAAQVEVGSSATSYAPFKLTLFAPGGAEINASVNDGSISNLKYAASSVSVDKTDFIRTGKNLFNPADPDYVAGYYVSGSSGLLVATPTLNASGYIPVVAGENYTVSTRNHLAWYGADKRFISGTSSTSPATITAPSGAAYLRITVADNVLSFFQVEEGTSATAHEAFSCYLAGPGNTHILSAAPLPLASVAPKNTTFLHIGKNLFNPLDPDFVADKYVNPNFPGQPIATVGFYASGYIPVIPGVAYTLSNKHHIAWYTESKIYISGSSASDTSKTQTAPANAAYLRVTINGAAALAVYQVEVGSMATEYHPFCYYIKGANGERVYAPGNWYGKTWASLGDSITNMNVWQPLVAGRFGLVHTEFGDSGTAISGSGSTAMCSDTRINAIATTFDLVSVLGGTNDWAQNKALGTLASVDIETFYGALNVLVAKLMARFPAKRVVLCTTTYGEYLSSVTVNSLGLTTNDYAECIRLVAKKWGLPCVDFAANCGWNTANITTYISNDGAYLHPNSLGAARMAEVFSGEISGIAPLK